MSAGSEGGMILLAAFLIVVRAIQELFQGPKIQSLELGLVLMVVAGVVNGAVGSISFAPAGPARSRWSLTECTCSATR